MQWLNKVLPQLPQHLLQDALVYAESEFALDPGSEMMQSWQIIKQSKAGNVFYHLLKSVQVEKA